MTIYNSLSSTHQILNHHVVGLPRSDNSNTVDHDSSLTTMLLGTAWYVCGPTVYDSAHLGHGRTYVSLDILRRVLLSLHADTTNNAPRPIYVMNITDVDDKIIQRSMTEESGAEFDNPLALARYYEMEFWQDMDSLNVLRPDVVCRVSEHVESTIVPYIEKILEGGMAYVIPEEEGCFDESDNDDSPQKQLRGSVYFDVRAFEYITNGRTRYGKLAPDVASSDFFSWDNNGSSVSNADDDDEVVLSRKKRDPRDFCLWKYRTQSPVSSSSSKSRSTIIEPSIVSYSSPWGPGRPGWHVECSAMIQRLSMDFRHTHTFQLHAGGIDLKFPHHSNEIAQAEAYNEVMTMEDGEEEALDDDGRKKKRKFEEWIPNWVHTGHLYVKGRKMSKSLKNFVTIREMLGTSNNINDEINAWSCPSDDFRLWCLGLSGSYRGPATYSPDRMEEARAIRTKWVKFLMEGQQCLEELKKSSAPVAIAALDCADNLTDKVFKSSTSSSKVWGEDELQLFNQVIRSTMKCRESLVGLCSENNGSTRGSFDLDGASFVKELTMIADLGLTYVQGTNIHKKTPSRPEEPLRFVLETFRRQLDLVGFTRHTVNAGISTDNVQASNTVLLDEIVVFRSAIRSATLNGMRTNDTMNTAKEVLKLCDELRDDILPSLGVELVDGKVGDGEGNKRTWRHCSPRNRIAEEKKETNQDVIEESRRCL